MVNASAKGSRFERDVCHYLNDHAGTDCQRIATSGGSGGFSGGGDITGLDGVHIECKNFRNETASFREGICQVTTDAEKKDKDYILFIKRNSKPVKESYAILSVEHLTKLLKRKDKDESRHKLLSEAT